MIWNKIVRLFDAKLKFVESIYTVESEYKHVHNSYQLYLIVSI